jgi:hypothetical protein
VVWRRLGFSEFSLLDCQARAQREGESDTALLQRVVEETLCTEPPRFPPLPNRGLERAGEAPVQLASTSAVPSPGANDVELVLSALAAANEAVARVKDLPLTAASHNAQVHGENPHIPTPKVRLPLHNNCIMCMCLCLCL